MTGSCGAVVGAVGRRLLQQASQWCSAAVLSRSLSSSRLCCDKNKLAARASGFEDTVWVEFTPLAQKHGAVNLSQACHRFQSHPLFCLACKRVPAEPGMHHQYTRVGGHPRLVNALARHYSPEYDRALDPLNNICVTVGATQGLLLFFQTFVDHGDEVIIIEPFYDSYIPQIEMCGGKAVAVSLQPPANTDAATRSSADWTLPLDELEAAFSPRTKAILLNTPHNPSGKVFSRRELAAIGALAEKHDTLILADEVYEKLLYDDEEHVHIASLPGMWERTVSLGSVGKAFNTTGWKIGWAIGPDHLIQPMQRTQQYTPFCVTTPLQEALARVFEEEPQQQFFQQQKDMFTHKRETLVGILQDIGLKPTIPQEHSHLAHNYARFCFVKTDEDIEEAGRRLRAHFL
ncbi:hypothetical protein PTSG_07452 [Salpingoeca rosetta]|uniref:Aminotransferase class I/classII large domain-containing protein n=1 Tax=Salpingoeca rosetta (strain ATCC 50818 / BSB-021) TaxID=946362 RepID=F2UIR9_SALR5|nr:uncharacterized protein PTSG_07452 [Salpingoeca rosetta]EGD77118.1 hypothetical protein PTSG_07452 [Salpingoeca rosetta]|eukprot:XP_004990957.1 hypothetical protein PTSG_07452 [Salpingoeca rosetta]